MNEIISYLSSFIHHYTSYADPHVQLARMSALMMALDNPQERLKVVHIAGTSGKGSTAHYISRMLTSQGFKTGLTVSPHLMSIGERAQIDNALLPEQTFCDCFYQITPAIESVSKSPLGRPSFFEITMALAYYIFAQQAVDYAIIETGLGGRYDGSNVVMREDKVCIITSIGIDHVEYLGNTVEKIAFEKAGIIQKNNHVIMMVQDARAAEIIKQVSKIQQATIQCVDVGEESRIVSHRVQFNWDDRNKRSHVIELQSPAHYQVQNVTLALNTIEYLAQRDVWPIEFTAMLNSLKSTRIPGRFDVKRIHNKTVVFDGAHNPQKMSTFLSSLCRAYPSQKFEFLIGFSAAKDYRDMLRMITPYASHITTTQFGEGNQGMRLSAAPCLELSSVINQLGYTNHVSLPDAKEAFDTSLARTSDMLIVTGSLYLLSDLYRKLDH